VPELRYPSLTDGPKTSAEVGIGTRLGKYEILKRLATGGMAEIFLARVSGLPGYHKMVVIKRILPQLATQTDFVEMFLDEARIAATLQHPNVVQMYDVGVVDGNYFIAMEYLHGEDVRSIGKVLKQRERTMPVEHAINIVLGVAAGLHYAHEKIGFDGRPLAIVHRDVTPQNVIVTYDGGVKLLDFGIAKASNRFGETRFGTLKGKVPYMSPEQCRGEPLDRRSDLFSLGIMLYELTLGRRLYHGKSDFEVLKQIVEGTVQPPRAIDPSYPPDLEAIVMRALEKGKDQRYQSARELQVDLEALVRADRMHVSPLALTGFLEGLFGPQMEAWREAQAHGTIDQHLQALPVTERAPDDDLDMLNETEARAAGSLARERAAFRARIDAEAQVETRVVGRPAPGEPPQPLASAPTTRAKTQPSTGQRPWWIAATIAASLLTVFVGMRLYRRVPTIAPPLPQRSAEPPPSPSQRSAELPPPSLIVPTTAPSLPPLVPTTTPPAKLDGEKRSHERRVRAKPVAPSTPAPLRGEGTLLIASTPWCNVRVDGVDRGPTPVSLKLPAGKHTLVLTNPEFKINRTVAVPIAPNETARKKFDFAP
jgi:serine/threonine protein kinase